MTTPRKTREKALTVPSFNQWEIFPPGLRCKSFNAAFYYSSFYASQSDEYDSDVPQEERVPLVTNDEKRHLKLVKRNKDLHQWKTKISESELQQLEVWTDEVSQTLQQFEIIPRRTSRQRQGEEGEGSRVVLPCVESETHETDCSSKAKEKKRKRKKNIGAVGDCESVIGDRKKKEKKKRGEVESATDCESVLEGGEKERKEKESRREVVDTTTDCESVIGDRKKKEDKKRGEVESATDCESVLEGGEKEKKEKESRREVVDTTTDCESVIGDRKKKKEKKKRGEVESATDCESTIVSEKERVKENEEGGEGSVYDSGLSVSSVGEKKKKKKKEKREGFGSFSDNLTESECEVRIGEDKGVRMKRQRGSGSEDGGGKSSYKRSKKEKRQSETEEEWSRVASKKSVMENIVKIGGKDKRRESGGKPVESPDSDDDFREDLRKKRESFLKTVVAKRCEKRHSMSDSEDGGVEELPTNQRSGKSPIKKTPVNEKSNSSDSELDTYKLVKSSTTNQRSGKSPIKKTPVNEKSNSSDSDSEDKRVNKSSTSIQRSGKSPIKKTPVNEKSNSSDSDSEDKRVNKSSTSNKFKSLKTVTSSLKKSSNDEMMSQDMFEADSDDEVENNSDPSESVKYNGDKSRNGDSDSDNRQGKRNSKSNSDKRRNSSKSNSDSDSSSKIHEKSKDSNKSMQDDKLWKRIEKKLSEGIKEEYFEEDVFYLEDLSDNDEIWVAPCPKSLDVSSLLGRKLNLTGRTDLKALQAKDGASNMDCEAWASPIDQADNVVYCLQASKNRKKMIINPLKLAGRVSIEEKIQMPSPHEVEFSTTMKLVMPENLKVRHPLLGAEFKNQPKTFNSEDLSSPRVQKKKKKSKSLEHESEIMRNPPPSINYTSTIEENCDESMERKKKKKKKKSRDNECGEGQEDTSSYSHKSGDTSNLSEGEKKKRKKDKKRSREEADEEPSLQEDVPCEESSEHSSKKKKKKKRRLDE